MRRAVSSEICYHYTPMQGCAGIIQSQSVWLTDYRFLNDKHELTHAMRTFLAHFGEQERSSFEKAFTYHGFTHQYCVFSLSRSAEILSQWRAYADDGCGVAMGFNTPFLRYAGIELCECQYEDHAEYIKDLATRYRRTVKSATRAVNARPAQTRQWVDRNTAVLGELIRELIVLKNPAFSEEKEVRGILQVKQDDLLVKVSGRALIPYTAVNLWSEEADDRARSMWVAVPEIWLGPKTTNQNRIALGVMGAGMSTMRQFDCGYV